MHERRCLVGDRLDQLGVAVPERVDGDAAREIEIALAALADQIAALASHRPAPAAGIDGHERGEGHRAVPQTKKAARRPPERAFTWRDGGASTPCGFPDRFAPL